MAICSSCGAENGHNFHCVDAARDHNERRRDYVEGVGVMEKFVSPCPPLTPYEREVLHNSKWNTSEMQRAHKAAFDKVSAFSTLEEKEILAASRRVVARMFSSQYRDRGLIDILNTEPLFADVAKALQGGRL